uniref:Sugar transporter n=1 Tax=Riptortus pedestris TaxID=329032 RepID=R4WPQ3_RIPPE|nr:sugar transporter [Riptortus pedestris]
MVSLMDFGNALTPIPTSYLMDWIGRKPTLFSSAVMLALASALSLAANNIWYLYFARIFAGMAKGVAFAVVPIYLAEVANIQIRGALSTMFIGFLNIGMFYAYFFGWMTTYLGLNISIAIIPVVFSILFLFVPESPYYLARRHKPQKATAVLAKYRQVDRTEEALIAEYQLIEKTVLKDLQNKGRFWDVVGTRGNRRAVLIIALLAIFQRASGISPSLAFMTVTLPETGGGQSREVYLVIFSAILVIANYVATPLIDNLGRKKLLIYSAISSAVIQFVTGIFYLFQNTGYNTEPWNWIPYASLIIFGITYSLGIGFIPSTLVGELFPTNVKCYASSISAILLAVVSFGVNRVFREFETQYMYFFFSFACVVCTIFCVFFVFETRGKTFLEIQEKLNEVSKKKINGTV